MDPRSATPNLWCKVTGESALCSVHMNKRRLHLGHRNPKERILCWIQMEGTLFDRELWTTAHRRLLQSCMHQRQHHELAPPSVLDHQEQKPDPTEGGRGLSTRRLPTDEFARERFP
jgi:hypothetical protein